MNGDKDKSIVVLDEEKTGAIVLWLVFLKKNGIWEDLLEDELSGTGLSVHVLCVSSLISVSSCKS